MINLILLVSFILGICVLFLAIGIILKKNGKFPETHISQNKNMRKMGIACAKHDEYEQCRQQNTCSSCSSGK